jgi:hypothetical protein
LTWRTVRILGPAVPTTDVDSSRMENKSAGFAPNDRVMLATEAVEAMNNLKQAYGEGAAAASPEPVSDDPPRPI